MIGLPDASAEADTVQPSAPRRARMPLPKDLIWVLIGSIVVISAVGFGLIYAPLVPLAVGTGLIYLAVPYTLFATFVGWRNRRKAAAVVATGKYLPGRNTHAENFTSLWQQVIISLNLFLSFIYIPLMLNVFSMTPVDDTGMLTMFLLAALVVAAVLMIVFSRYFLYTKETLQAEAYAISQKMDAAKYIKINRVWSYVIWYLYAVTAFFIPGVLI